MINYYPLYSLSDVETFSISFLDKIGIKHELKGFGFLVTSISLGVQHPELLNSFTSGLYVAVAKVHNTTPQCVERNMRHAINVAYSKNPKRVCRIFNNVKPYNSELITLAVDDYNLHVKIITNEINLTAIR